MTAPWPYEGKEIPKPTEVLRQPADATATTKPLVIPKPTEVKPSRFKDKHEWRAHMDKLAGDGNWKRRDWIRK